jgi:DHA1 family bicyclomycin/chloramphenicol resistance-like MFS transporter
MISGNLAIFRFFQAVGAYYGMVLGRTIVGDLFKKEAAAQIFASIFPIIGMSPAISPMIGGFLTSYFNWRPNFLLLVIVGRVYLLCPGCIFVCSAAVFSRFVQIG